jgi:parvulin-like peptidyl-prolyl isomerase
MKALSFLILSCLIVPGVDAAWAQSAPSSPAPPAGETSDTVIATFDDGVTMTAGQYQALLAANASWQGQNREQVIHKYGVLRKAAALAKSRKLDEKSPYKEALEFSTMVSLAGFAAADAVSSLTPDSPEVEKFYDEHKEPYKQIQVGAIKVAFGGTTAPDANPPVMASRAPRKTLTEEEAKAKAEKLVAQLRAGASFATLVQRESDDETSKAKGGDLGTWRMTDNVPDAMRAAVINLKEGEVSDPVRQAGGFYIFHAGSVTYTPLADVRDAIFAQVKQMRASEWVRDLDRSTTVEFPAGKELQPGAQSGPSGQAK